MGREKCCMVEELSGKLYCGYYDIAVMLCSEVPDWDCAEELADDDDYEEYIGDDEYQHSEFDDQ